MKEQEFNWDYIARDESTPRFPPMLARDMLDLGLTKGRTTLYDPFMGNGTILLQAVLSHRDRIQSIYGMDINPEAVTAAQLNLEQFGRGIDYSVEHGNCFSTYPIRTKDDPIVIVSDPPFGRRCSWTNPDGTQTAESKVNEFLKTLSKRTGVAKVVLCLDPNQNIGRLSETQFRISKVEEKKDRKIYLLTSRN